MSLSAIVNSSATKEVYGPDIEKRLSYNYKLYEDKLVERKLNIYRLWEDWMKTPIPNSENMRVDEAARNPVTIHRAAENGQYKVPDFLLNNGADVDALVKCEDDDNNTSSSVSALHTATFCGDEKCVETLMERGAKRFGGMDTTSLCLS
ncbi:hypothetical protein FO519_007372 [Halicephalobus sp. NKZ332]|nr:hypothetical protein FO519_007372 [Halicephalobus sp. NKZ332]